MKLIIVWNISNLLLFVFEVIYNFIFFISTILYYISWFSSRKFPSFFSSWYFSTQPLYYREDDIASPLPFFHIIFFPKLCNSPNYVIPFPFSQLDILSQQTWNWSLYKFLVSGSTIDRSGNRFKSIRAFSFLVK